MNKFSYFKAPIKNTVPLESVTVERLAQGIKNGYAKGVTEKLRSLGSPDEARFLKASGFDYVTFSGVFSERSSNKLLEYSGLMALDFDHVDVTETKAKLLNQKEVDTVMLFVSPSGDGVKWVIPSTTADEHAQNFRMYQLYCEKALNLIADESGKDIARACFIPHDSDVYVTDDFNFRQIKGFSGQLSNVSFEDKHIVKNETNDDSPFADYDRRGDVLALLVKHGWRILDRQSNAERVRLSRPDKKDNGISADYLYSDRLLYVFTSSTDFEGSKAYPPATVYTVLEHKGDFKEAYKFLIRDGYGADSKDNTLRIVKIKKSSLPERLAAICDVNGFDKSKVSDEKSLAQLLAKKDENLDHYPLNPLFISLKNFTDTGEWILSLDIRNEKEIYNAIRELYKNVISDESARQVGSRKKLHFNYDTFYRSLYSLSLSPDRLERYAKATATEIWFTHFVAKLLRANVRRMFYFDPDKSKMESLEKRIMQVYKFTSLDMEKIRYFVCQCKADYLHPSLNKVLYFYGGKFTGKTTIAAIITCILNGENNTNNIGDFKSNLSKEMQMGQFDIPTASRANCVLMDEAFFKDMGKSYDRFKEMITSDSTDIQIKFKSPSFVSLRRNYIITSNKNLVEHIKDYDDRRYLEINMDVKPEKLSFDEIFQLWRDYIINISPDKAMSDWYDDMLASTVVEGEYRKRTDDLKSEMKTNSFISSITSTDRYITNAGFHRVFRLLGYEPPSKVLLQQALVEILGEPPVTKGRWVVSDVIDILNDELWEDNDDSDITKRNDDLPF